MGVTAAAAEFLIQAAKDGACFNSTLMLGHQSLFVSPQKLKGLLEKYQCWPPYYNQKAFYDRLVQCRFYADPLFTMLGATQLQSMDASAYEDAEIVHDLNEPVPAELRESFDLVFDGGTLEHVFNLPTALRNCMEMVKPGGHLILYVVANNQFGHGFYQFSPELFFRALSRENGYEVRRMVVFENVLGASSIFGLRYGFQITGAWYDVRDPQMVKARHTLVNDRPVELLIQAQRVHATPIFSRYPQQSDYAAGWAEHQERQHAQQAHANLLKEWVKQRLPAHVRFYLRIELLARLLQPIDLFRYRRWKRRSSIHNRTFYTPAKG